MGRHKSRNGKCRICGENTKLSFEHVPPRSTFNKNTTYLDIPFNAYIQSNNPLAEEIKGKKREGGIGYYSLCKECNSLLGSKYVPAYQKWVQAGVELSKYKEKAFKVIFKDQQPLNVLKQIVSMLLSINKEWYLNSYPQLSQFVKNPKERHLHDRYRLFCYLNTEGNIRYSSHTVVGSLTGKQNPINCTEMAYPPFGYVLTIDHEDNFDHLTEITRFKSFDYGEKKDIKIGLIRHPTFLPIPLDYRTKSEIEDTIKQNEGL